MKKNFLGMAVALAFVFAPVVLRAQQNPVSSAVRQSVARQAQNLTAGAQEMPAAKFGYAPTPAQMTFGHMVLHVAQSNGMLCSAISGDKAPSTAGLTEKSSKAKLIAAMKASFTFCDQALAKVNDSDLTAEVPFFGGRKVSRATAMIELTNDLADHYAQQAIYLRLNNHLPPTAMGRRGMGGRMGRGGGRM